jgi:hypothetical protein
MYICHGRKVAVCNVKKTKKKDKVDKIWQFMPSIVIDFRLRATQQSNNLFLLVVTDSKPAP